MRLPATAILLAAVAVAPNAAPAQASSLLDASRFCARYSDGSTNCGFYNFAQCTAAVSGVGGTCQISPYGDNGVDALASARRASGSRRR